MTGLKINLMNANNLINSLGIDAKKVTKNDGLYKAKGFSPRKDGSNVNISVNAI